MALPPVVGNPNQQDLLAKIQAERSLTQEIDSALAEFMKQFKARLKK